MADDDETEVDLPDQQAAAPSAPAQNYFDRFDAPASAAEPRQAGNFFDRFDHPATAKGGNYFDQFDEKPQPKQPEAESGLMTAVRAAAHNILPGAAAVGAGVLTAPAGPWVSIPAAVGTFMGARKLQDEGLKLIGGDDNARMALNAEAHPYWQMAGELASALPFGAPGIARTAAGRIAVGTHALGGALGGGLEAGSQYLEKGTVDDPTRVAAGIATGAALVNPTGLTQGIERAVQTQAGRLTRAVPHGSPGATAAAGTAEAKPAPTEAGGAPQPTNTNNYAKAEPRPASTEEAAGGVNVGSDPTIEAALRAKMQPEGEAEPSTPARTIAAEQQPGEVLRGPEPAAAAPEPPTAFGQKLDAEFPRNPDAAAQARPLVEERAPPPPPAQAPAPPKFSVALDTETHRHVLFRDDEPIGDFANRDAALKARTAAMMKDTAARRAAPAAPVAAPADAAGGAPPPPVPPPSGGGAPPRPPVPPVPPGAPPPLGALPPHGGAPPPITPRPGAAPPPRFPLLRKVMRTYQEMFQPETISPDALQADPLFAKRAAYRSMEHKRIINDGQERLAMWTKVPEPDQIKFLSDVENRRSVQPQFDKAAKAYRSQLDAADSLEKQWGSKAGYVQDYLPHQWEAPPPGQMPIAQYFTETLGPTWFQKARTIDFIDAGLAAGYKLKTTNPELIVRSRLMAGADMRATMELLESLQKMNLAVKTKGAAVPKDWMTINAPDREQWAIRQDIAPTWQNAVAAKGLWADQGLKGDAFRGWMEFKSVWVPIKLAVSAFHPLHVYHINFSSSLARAAKQLEGGDFNGAIKTAGMAFSPYQAVGKMARSQALLGEHARTPEGKLAVQYMEEGGVAPHGDHHLQEEAGIRFAQAIQDKSPFKAAFNGLSYLNQKTVGRIFSQWIPHLKVAAYLNDAAVHMQQNPQLANDPVARGIALRAIAKSNENRFGEMFYGGLFWNKMTKELSIGSFLSLGWNLGFVREFGGAAYEAGARPAGRLIPALAPSAARQVARDATNKIAFASIYMATAAAIAGTMTKIFTGDNPKDSNDYIFPRIGGVNPDGSPRRLTTMFYSREGPMLAKHIQEQGGGIGGTLRGLGEMLWNKTMFQPIKELWQNRNYFGREIWDTNAPAYKQLEQVARHIIGEQFMPMSITGAKRAQETGGRPIETPLALAGFGPAPAYAEKSAMQNRIGHMFREHVSPEVKPYQDEDVTHAQQVARNAILMAKQRNDPAELQAATEMAQKSGMLPKSIAATGKVPSDVYMFGRLPTQDQTNLLQNATPEEYQRYWPKASRATKQQWNKEHAQPGR